jgi:hypothetical protein
MTNESFAGFAAPAAGALAPVAGEVAQVRRKAEVGGLRLSVDAANALLRQLAALKRRAAGLVADSADLNTPLRFGDNWVGELLAARLRTVAVDRSGGVTSVLTAFTKVLTDLEHTIRAAAGLYYTTDEESADEFRRAVGQLGLEAEQ